MYHPSIWHPIDMAAAFRSLRQPSSIPSTSPEKFSTPFSVNTLLNQSSADHLRIPTMATAAQQHQLFSSLFQHYPYVAAFRPLFNSATNSSSDSPAGKRFKNNSHDENHCETTSNNDESFTKYTDARCRSSATIDLKNPQCPICQVSLNGQDLITHIQHEIDSIDRRQKQKIKHENKILHENHNTDQTFKTRYETFLRVRTSRQQRLNAKLQYHNRRTIRSDTRNCPICYQLISINSDEEYFFTHVQQCSRKREQLAAVNAIANHHLTQNPTATIDDPDVNVVDVDDDMERDEKSTSGTTSLSCQESFNSDQRYSPSTQTDISYSKSPNVNEIDPPKCVVCMESCIKPCVSINCWHINCEECWIKYLNEKHSCPQCNLSLTLQSLRRVFFNKISK